MGIALITNNILSDSGTAIAGLVPTSRTISTTAPLTGGGDLSANRTIAIPAATTTVDGYLTSADWTIFNGKQAAGNYITSLTGEATAAGPGAAAVTLNNASVTGKVLTGVNITGGTVLATDTMLTAFGKLQNQINGLIGSTIYQGVWNASTNTPTLTSSVGTNGFYYIVNVAGNTNLDGITDWKIGDWAIFNGGVWQKVDNTESVTSVNGFTGAVSLTTDNIAEGTTNLYFSNARARAAISLTVTGASGASTYNNTTGVLNVPTYTLAGLGGQPLATNLTSLAGLTFASTAFVKMTAAGTFALDTNTYLTTGAAASTYLPLAGGTLTGNLDGTSASFSKSVNGTLGAVASMTMGIGTSNDTVTKHSGFGFGLNTGTYYPAYIAFVNASTTGSTKGEFRFAVRDVTTDTAPTVALTIATSGAATFASSVTATSIIKSGGTASQFLMADGSVSTGPAGGITGSLTTNYVTKATGTNTIGNSLIFDNGTNVGIGTVTPNSRLHISGTGAELGIQIAKNGSDTVGAGPYIALQNLVNSRQYIMQLGASNDLILNYWGGSSYTERFRIFSTGEATFSSSLGINGVTPVAELQVGKSSDVTFAMSNSSSVITGNRGSIAWYNSSVSTVANIRAVAITDNVGTQLEFYTRPAAGSLTQVLTLASTGAATFSSSVTTGGDVSLPDGNSLRIGGQLIANRTGNEIRFGSGTAADYLVFYSGASLNFTLNTLGNAIFNGSIRSNAGIFQVFAAGVFRGGLYNYASTIGSGTDYSPSLNSETNLYFTTGGSGTQKMTILSGGNVGIGTTTPQMPLSVQANTGNGAIRLIGTSSGGTSNAGIYWYDSNDTTFNGYMGNFSASFDIYNQRSTPMAFYTAGTERMQITSGGTIIARNGGQFRIERGGNYRVNSNADGLIGYLIRSGSWKGTSEDNLSLATDGPYGISFFTNGSTSERLLITSGGNVLIGTTNNQGQRLQVVGDLKISGTSELTAAGSTSVFLVNNTISGGSSSGTVGLYFGDTGSGINLLTREKVSVNTANTVIYSEYGYNIAVKAVSFFNANSTFFGSVTATSFFESSDATIKTLITDNYQAKGIESVVAKLYIKNGKEELGYFAQDVEGILPSAVGKGDEGLLTLSYREVHTAKIARLEKELEELKAKLN